jgi:hypothetical protein
LSDISQSAWENVQQDFGLQMVALQAADLPAVEHVSAIKAFEWRSIREDDQKSEYMAYIRDVIPLDERTGM